MRRLPFPNTATRATRLVALSALLAAGCTGPPPQSYVASGTEELGEPVSAGRDAVNAECLVQPGHTPPTERSVLQTRVVFCGGWTQPAARVVELQGGSATSATLDAISAGGVWRSWLEQRLVCGQPVPTTLAGGAPARLLPCTRKNGGWPHLALVAAGSRGVVLADGLPSALPAIERVAQGRIGAAAGPAPRSAALTLVAAQLSAQAFGSADVGRYEQLMALGRELNQAENFAAAEDAYRGALRIQERVLGPTDPNVAAPLMHLALNLSNQGRHTQAEQLFVRAASLAPRAADPTAQPRLLHYRGLHALNTDQPREAAALLERAERGYAASAPVDSVLRAGPVGQDDLTDGLLLDPTTLSALVGIAEARRTRAVALTRDGRAAEGAALAAASRELLQSAGLQPGTLVGRSLRSQGGSTALLGREADAAQLFGASAQHFSQALPGERPEAATLFLAGARLRSTGRDAEALQAFRAGSRILRERQIGLPVELVLPYLDALEQTALRDTAGAPVIHAEMFEAAQLARRPQTARLVAQAAARLGAAEGNPRVAAAVRQLQDVDRELRALLAERDAADPRDTAPLDERIRAAQSARAAAESEAAAAAPGYRQLLQAVIPADATRAALGPHEALVTMLLGRDHGYAFALRADGTTLARRVALPEGDAARLVTSIRAGIAPPDGSGPGTFDADAAHALHRRLLAPLTLALDGVATLVVVPDGPLLSIPFGLLLAAPAAQDELRDADWLVRRHAIVHMPSAQTLVMLRTRAGASRAPLSYVGFGDPAMPSLAQLARTFPQGRCPGDVRLAASLPPLPGTRAELLAARQIVGAPPGAVTLGTGFTAASLRNADLDRYRIVHLATHALLPGELSCLQEPAIIASAPRNAPDASAAFIEATEVLDLKLDADLVILSACNTGTVIGGSGTGGEALSGLSRAFFFAGARGLMVTHWPVADAVAALTVADTLRRQAREGQDAATALRGAQLLILNDAGRGLPASFAHPFYWAGFALIGDGPRAAAAAARGPIPPREG